MKHYTDYIFEFMTHYKYPAEAIEAFTGIEKRLDDEPEFGAAFDDAFTKYMLEGGMELNDALNVMEQLANEYGENVYTMQFVFILNCMPVLKDNYKKAGYSDELFENGADDLRCKLIECINCKEVPGTFVAGWNDGFLKMRRFAYGRFQFEVCTYNFDFDFVMPCGHRVSRGDTYINFHIPSSGIPLTDEVRLDSYKKAFEAYKHLFNGGPVLFGCGSWLLYPGHREFLPPHLNILKFMDDFTIVSYSEKDGFGNDWRVFDKYASLPYDKLPRDTSLRRAYADRLLSGGKTGDGFGVFLFDGEKIIH